MESINTLQTICDSFKQIGIDLGQVYWPVSSIDDWLDKYAGRVNILPNVLDPELFLKYVPKDQYRMDTDLLVLKENTQNLFI